MKKQNETNKAYVKLLLAQFEQRYNLDETDEAVVEYLKRYHSVVCCRRKNNYHERAKKLCCLAHLQPIPRTYKDVLNSLIAYLYKWKNSEELGGETRLYNLTGICRPITEGERFYSAQVWREYQLEKLCQLAEIKVDSINDYCFLYQDIFVSLADIVSQIPDDLLEKAKGFLIEPVDDELISRFPQINVMHNFKVVLFGAEGLSNARTLV